VIKEAGRYSLVKGPIHSLQACEVSAWTTQSALCPKMEASMTAKTDFDFSLKLVYNFLF